MSRISNHRDTLRLLVTLAVGWVVLFTATYVPPGPGYNSRNVYSAYGYPLLLAIAVTAGLAYVLSNRHLPIDVDVTGVFAVLLSLMVLPSVLRPSTLRWVLPVVAWHAMIYSVLFVTILDRSVSIREYERYFSVFIVVFGVCSAVLGLYAGFVSSISFGPIAIVQGATDRLFGWYGNPNPFGSMIGVAIVCSVGRYWTESTGRRWLYLLALAVCVPGLYFSASQGAIVSTVGALVTLWVFHTRRERALVAVGMLGGTTVVAILAVSAAVGELSALMNAINQGSIHARIAIWAHIIPILADSSVVEILIGHGHNYFTTTIGRSPHNGYVRSLINYGVVFLLVYVYLIKNVLQWTWWSVTENRTDVTLFFSLFVYLLLKDIPSQSTFRVRFEGFLLIAIVVPFAVLALRESELWADKAD